MVIKFCNANDIEKLNVWFKFYEEKVKLYI